MRRWILHNFRKLSRWCLLAALFASPAVFHRETVDVFNLTKLTVLWVGGILAGGFWIAWSAERGVWPPLPKLALPAAAFLVVAALATILSDNPLISLVGLYHRYGGLIPFTLYALIAAVAVGLYWERPEQVRQIAVAAAWASIVMTVYALIQAAGQDWIAWKDPSTDKAPEFVVSTMGNSNFAGGYLGLAVPYLLFLAGSAKTSRGQLFYGLMWVGELLALYFTSSRGGMIAAGAALLSLAFIYRDRLPRMLKAAAATALVVFVIVALLVVAHPGSDEPPEPLRDIRVLRTGTLEVRAFYWAAAIRIFADNPVIGTGLETYFSYYPQYRLPDDGRQLQLSITDKPHNIFLEYLSNAGILGLTSYLMLVGMALWFGYREARKPDNPNRFLLATFVGGLAGYLAQGLVSIDVPPLAMMGWVGLAGVATLADPAVAKGRAAIYETPNSSPAGGDGKGAHPKQKVPRPPGALAVRRQGPPLRPVYLAVAIAVAGLAVMGIRPYRADVLAKESQTAENSPNQKASALPRLERAIRLYPWEASYRARAGSLLLRQATETQDAVTKERLIREAIAHHKAALSIQPGNLFYLMNVGRAYQVWAETLDSSKFEEADKWWRRAEQHDSTNPAVHARYGQMLFNWATRTKERQVVERAAKEFELVSQMTPQDVNAWVNLAKTYRLAGRADDAKEALDKALKVDPKHEEAKKLLASL